jgi:hypothetical protein
VNEHRLELVAEGFSFPTSLTFDAAGIAALPPDSWDIYGEAVRLCSVRYSSGDFIPSAECGACSL